MLRVVARAREVEEKVADTLAVEVQRQLCRVRAAKREFDKKNDLSPFNVIRQPNVVSDTQRALDRGARIFARVETQLNKFKWAAPGSRPEPFIPSREQKIVHRAMLNAALPQMYGLTVWTSNKNAILAAHEYKKHSPFVMFEAARRFGKTLCFASMYASLVAHVPGFNGPVFSPGKRASKLMMQAIKKFVVQIPGISSRTCINTDEHLAIAQEAAPLKKMPGGRVIRTFGKQCGDISRLPTTANIKAFPASGNQLRGTNGGFVGMEEFLFMNPEQITAIAFPLLSMQGSGMMCVSSPNKETSFGNILSTFVHEDTKVPIFEVIRFNLSCRECADANLVCVHTKVKVPPWQNKKSREAVKVMMAGNNEQFQEEALGLAARVGNVCFPVELIDRCMAAERLLVVPASVNRLFLAIDPAGGSDLSDYAMVTMSFSHGLALIVHASVSDSDKTEAIIAFVRSHLETLLEHCGAVQLVVMIEANMSFLTSDGLKNLIERHWPPSMVHFMMHDKPIRPEPELARPHQPCAKKAKRSHARQRVGVWTGRNKQAYKDHLFALLKADHIRFCAHINKKVIETIAKQMKAFRRVVQKTGDGVTQKSKVIWSGKAGNQKDDLVMTMMICVYWTRRFLLMERSLD